MYGVQVGEKITVELPLWKGAVGGHRRCLGRQRCMDVEVRSDIHQRGIIEEKERKNLVADHQRRGVVGEFLSGGAHQRRGRRREERDDEEEGSKGPHESVHVGGSDLWVETVTASGGTRRTRRQYRRKAKR